MDLEPRIKKRNRMNSIHRFTADFGMKCNVGGGKARPIKVQKISAHLALWLTSRASAFR
jgi:hypothetical protein